MTRPARKARAKTAPKCIYVVSRPGNGMVRVSYTKPTIFIGETVTKYERVGALTLRPTR